jgi:hypothetical protein
VVVVVVVVMAVALAALAVVVAKAPMGRQTLAVVVAVITALYLLVPAVQV